MRIILFKNKFNRHFGWTYFKLVAVSIGGLLTAETILFFQWHWTIAPEYRKMPGDMSVMAIATHPAHAVHDTSHVRSIRTLDQ
jgi:hypothetical protein